MSKTEQSKPKNMIRIIWSAAEENMLLDLWQEKIEELRCARKNSLIFQEMTAKLEEAGLCGSWIDVRTKVDNLTRKYRQEKTKLGPTGGTPSPWEHFQRINNILRSFKVHNIERTMHESTDKSTLLEETGSIVDIDPLDYAPEQFSGSCNGVGFSLASQANQ